jgi:hypothetical protein
MPDPFTASARFIFADYLSAMRADVEALPPDGLNWKPAGDATNSIASLVTHSLHSTRYWICIALGEPLPERDRDAEFLAETPASAQLTSLIDDLGGQVLALLEGRDAVEWAANRKSLMPADPSLPDYVPAAFAVLHAVEHFSQHVGHVGLTRQLWEQADKRHHP